MNIYDNIKRQARKKGLTISQVESKAGLAQGHIGKWNTVSPRVDSLLKVAKVLGVSANALLKEE